MKGMTNALPVLIDASTLATKSDISDMETKTHANATFATKTALTTLQNATKVAVENFAITESADKVTITTTAIDGATSKSEDIPTVTDTMAGVVTPALKKKWDSIVGLKTKIFSNFTEAYTYIDRNPGFLAFSLSDTTQGGRFITVGITASGHINVNSVRAPTYYNSTDIYFSTFESIVENTDNDEGAFKTINRSYKLENGTLTLTDSGYSYYKYLMVYLL